MSFLPFIKGAFPFGGQPPTQYSSDISIIKATPGIQYYDQTGGGAYAEDRFVSGAFWRALNAQYGANGWQQIVPTLPSYALTLQANGAAITYSAPAGALTPISWIPTSLGGLTAQAPIAIVGGVIELTGIVPVANGGNGTATPTLTPGFGLTSSGSWAAQTLVVPGATQWLNVRGPAFGATGNGSTDDTAAIQAALTAATGGGVVYLPNGTYKITSTLTIPAAVTLLGESRGNTFLVAGTASMTMVSSINASLTNVSNQVVQISFDGNNLTGVVAVAATLAQNLYVSQCSFYGCRYNVYFDRCQFYTVTDCIAATSKNTTGTAGPGTFAAITTLDTATGSFGIFRGCTVWNNGNGTQSQAFYFRRQTNLFVDQCFVNDMTTGNGSPGTAFTLENASSFCTFANCGSALGGTGLLIQQGSGAVAQPNNSSFTNCILEGQSAFGIEISQGNHLTFSGCIVNTSVAVPGIQIGGTITSSLIFDGIDISSSGVGGTGIAFAAGAVTSQILITSCIVNETGAGGIGISFPATGSILGTSVQSCIFNVATGVLSLGAALFTNLRVIGNIVGSTPMITGTATQLAQAGNLVRDNAGYVASANQAPAFPATTIASTNTTGYAVKVYVANGTSAITVVTINGVVSGLTIPLSTQQFVTVLEPGDSIAFTYGGGAPTWTWLPVN